MAGTETQDRAATAVVSEVCLEHEVGSLVVRGKHLVRGQRLGGSVGSSCKRNEVLPDCGPLSLAPLEGGGWALPLRMTVTLTFRVTRLCSVPQ